MSSQLDDAPSSSVRNGTLAAASSSISSSALVASGALLAFTASTSSSRSSLAAAVGAGFMRPAKKPPLASEVTASATSTMSAASWVGRCARPGEGRSRSRGVGATGCDRGTLRWGHDTPRRRTTFSYMLLICAHAVS